MSDRGRMTVAVFHEPSGWVLPDDAFVRIERACGDRLEPYRVRSRNELIEHLPKSECLVGFPFAETPDAAAMEKLRWVQLTSAAGDAAHALRGAMAGGVRVSTASSIRAPLLAEHALMLLLALIRRLPQSIARQTEHEWSSTDIARRIGTLMDRTVAVLADGSTGEEIAIRLKAFGARVLATRRDPTRSYLHVDDVYGTADLDDMLSRADALIVALPRLPSTVGLLDQRRLSRMSRDAVLVDVSRGGVVDEMGLLNALRKDRLAGAGIDAFEADPLPQSSPFWTMPNVVLTPRVASAGPKYWLRASDQIGRNIERYLAGKPLIDEIDPAWIEDGPLG